MIKQPYMQN